MLDLALEHLNLIQYGCPVSAVVCYQVAKIHYKSGQMAMLAIAFDALQRIAATWPFLEQAVKRMSQLCSNDIPLHQR
jgi:hypothetical protein